MSNLINPIYQKISPKQRKDLLAIYRDCLYFAGLLKLVLKENSESALAYMCYKEVGWLERDEKGNNNVIVPWKIALTNEYKSASYKEFVSGKASDTTKYTYISLFHTDKKQDAPLRKVTFCPQDYDIMTIDMDLPCEVERFSVAFPKDQKVNDAELIIDGKYQISYDNSRNKDIGDLTIAEALKNEKIQKELRLVFGITRIYFQKIFSNEYIPEQSNKLASLEQISVIENKVLDLLGSCTDKAQEILRDIYKHSLSSEEDVWVLAEKDKLIPSAETMKNLINIRHLLRHQWDSLDNININTLCGNDQEDSQRHIYLDSYQLICSPQKTNNERAQSYLEYSSQFIPLIQALNPEFIVREKGESNTSFIRKISEWQAAHPDIPPVINTGYLLATKDKDKAKIISQINALKKLATKDKDKTKITSQINALKKVDPDVIIIDYLQKKDFQENTALEQDYILRTAYLKAFSYIYSGIAKHCLANDIKIQNAWQYLKQKKFLTEDEYQRWLKYYQLRNDLSHKHFSPSLRNELNECINTTFNDDAHTLQIILHENTPLLVMDTEGNIWVKRGDKYYPVKPQSKPHTASQEKRQPVKLESSSKDKEVTKCIFENGIIIDLKAKKIYFPNGSYFYLNNEAYAFNFGNGTMLFMDKTFKITRYINHGKDISVHPNEQFSVVRNHLINTDKDTRLSKSSILQKDTPPLVTEILYQNGCTIIKFPDKTELSIKENNFIVSHNGIRLEYKTIKSFLQSYDDKTPTSSLPKKDQNSR